MDDKKVRSLTGDNKDALRKPLYPLTGKWDKTQSDGWTIVGLDTEFNNTIEPPLTISYQLWVDEERKKLIEGPQKLSLRQLAAEAWMLAGRPQKIIIPAFYNTAELSQLAKPFWEEKDVEFYTVHPAGLYHVEGWLFPSYNKAPYPYFLYYDLWHFFASLGGSSLYKVAENFGFSKLEYDVTNLSLDNLNDPAFREYAIHDAKLCVEIFNELDGTYRKASGVSIISRPTAAGAAQASFRLRYLKGAVKAPNATVRRLALRANWAARVECGFIGEMPGVYEYDADSLYPRSTLLLPGLPGPNDWYLAIPQSWDGVEGFVEVTGSFPSDEEWPCIPVWSGTSLCFPINVYRAACTIGELRTAITRGFTIQTIHCCAYYTSGSNHDFHDFIRDQIILKELADKEGNKALRAVAKLNMNSAIGKFIQNRGGVNYNAARQFIADKDLEEWIQPLIYANLTTSYQVTFNEKVRLGSSFYPEWHTLILGKSREVMANAIFSSPDYPRILMISTDSLHLPSSKIGDTLVPFKLEFGPAFYKSIRGKVHISIDERTGEVLKLAKHAMPLPDHQAVMAILASDHSDTFEVERHGRTTLRDAVLLGTQIGMEKVLPNYKVSMKPDSKRRLDDEGWTHPLQNIEQQMEMQIE